MGGTVKLSHPSPRSLEDAVELASPTLPTATAVYGKNNYKRIYAYKYELSGVGNGDVDCPSHHPELFAIVALQNKLAIEVEVTAEFCERCAVHHHTFKCVREHLRIDSLHRGTSARFDGKG
jgi:hypothetical protein